MNTGLVNLNNILEDSKGNNNNQKKVDYSSGLKKNDSDLWDF